MNILFLSLGDFENLGEGSVHIDVLKRLAEDHETYLVCKRERRHKKPTELSREYGINVLRVKTGNIKNTNLIEKGISTVLVEYQFLSAIKKYLKDVKIDLILYTTPPITLVKTIDYVKRKCGAKTYLMLKDIFPQNAVDIGMISTSGVKSLLYKYFRGKEKKLYAISDKIGCMSQANCDYVLRNNPEVAPEKVEICPNVTSTKSISITDEERVALRTKYELPLDKKIFVYGGNLGKPQGISFIIDCMRAKKNENAFFLIIGGGTEYQKLENFISSEKPENVKLMYRIPKDDYNLVVAACDVGMIFLDHRFTIPNFPSRLLSYMQAGLPVLACTDPNTDVGQVIVEGGFGWWCESNDVDAFVSIVDKALTVDLDEMKINAKEFLNENYTVDRAYEVIVRA